MRRQPEALADVTLQPVMFVLLFAYVFGGAIQVSGGGYREFLMGGIFAQTIVFGAFGVAIALAYDRSQRRHRPLPLAAHGARRRARRARGGEPDPRACSRSCSCRSAASSSAGGSTPSVADAVGGYALMIAFSFAVIWLGVLLGSLLPSAEAVQGVAFIGDLPGHLHRQHLRAGRHAAGGPAHDRRVEPGDGDVRGAARSCSATRAGTSAPIRPGRWSTRWRTA